MQFIVFTLAAAFFFALTFYFRQQAGKFLPTPVALSVEVVVELTVLVVLSILISPQALKGLSFQTKGIIFPIFAGIAIASGVILNFLALKTGFLSKVTALTSPSQIIFGILLGVFLAGESFTFKQIIGTVISIIGMLLVIIK